jgi:hypothetical protein
MFVLHGVSFLAIHLSAQYINDSEDDDPDGVDEMPVERQYL